MRNIMMTLLSLSLVLAIAFGLFMKSANMDAKADEKSISIIKLPDEDDNDNTGW